MTRCGLITAERQPVPLRSIEVQLQVRDHVATVVSALSYENKEDKPIEAVFVFPLPGDAAVCHFSATIGQTQIVAEVKEKQQAREEYDDALSSGQQAFLLEESDQSPDIFSLSVGSLPPGESASIRLEYVTELAVQADDGLRFCLPAVLNPRYQPRGSDSSSVEMTYVAVYLVPYSLSFSARLSSPRPISKVESSSSLDPLQYLNAEQTQATVKLAAGYKFDRDVELLIYYKDAHQPSAVVEAGQASAKPGSLMGDPAVMVSLYPEFPQAVMSSVASCGEFVFMLDRSGSMGRPVNNANSQETRISNARDTLLLLLKSLPMGCYFNIYSFGSTFEHIFPQSVEYSEKTMDEALKKVKVMQADLGGTEILQPLQHIYSLPCVPNQPRQLFVFTDGEVGNTKEVMDLVKRNSGSHRCFSFGIGEGASSALINGLAKEGGGHAQFITGADRMQSKVMQSLQFSLQPVVDKISITWDLPPNVSATVLSPPIATIFQGQRSLIYAQITGQTSQGKEGCVKVKYSLAGHDIENQLHFSLSPAEDTGLTVHRLAARTLIRSLELEEREARGQDGEMKKKLVELSVQSGVSSAYTAFIAVNKCDGKNIQGPLVRRNIPVPMMTGRRRGVPQSLSSAVSSFRRFTPNFLCKRVETRAMPVAKEHAEAYSTLSRAQVDYDSTIVTDAPKTKTCIRFTPNFLCKRVETRAMPVAKEPAKVYSTLSRAQVDYDSTIVRDDAPMPEQPHTDPLLQLVSLQKASGCWTLGPALAAAMGKTIKEVKKPKPRPVNQDVWATVLALIWLHGLKADAKKEWELLAMKAVSWLRAQNAPCVKECVEAGNTVLGCSVTTDALGF